MPNWHFSLNRRYERTKNAHGGDRKSSDQIDHLKKTAAKIARELGKPEAVAGRESLVGSSESRPGVPCSAYD
jgi:hypothetical protein